MIKCVHHRSHQRESERARAIDSIRGCVSCSKQLILIGFQSFALVLFRSHSLIRLVFSTVLISTEIIHLLLFFIFFSWLILMRDSVWLHCAELSWTGITLTVTNTSEFDRNWWITCNTLQFLGSFKMMVTDKTHKMQLKLFLFFFLYKFAKNVQFGFNEEQIIWFAVVISFLSGE